MQALDVDSWAVLSRLLDDVLELPCVDRTRWIDDLPPEYHPFVPRLRVLLSEAESADAAAFLDTIPKVDPGGPIPTEDHEPLPASIGPYRILRKLGEGGMGTVWLAQRSDGMIKRPIALKLPSGAWFGGASSERMARERDILATLNHPNIARLYDAGVTAFGQPYLALEFVPGRHIDEYANAQQLSVRARLHLFLQVARAVAHAHARLIVHRDLKPSNILVTDLGEVKLLDFGIAKLLEEGSAQQALTETSGPPLTPDYASPEQIAGQSLSIASDVYTLGVVLYELLAGRRPYSLRRDSRGALEDAILQAVPRRPSDAASDRARKRTLRGDLDTIVLKTLRKRPHERYETVNAFADDIERYLDGRPVLAQPQRLWYRASKFIARNALAVGAAASVLTIALTGAGLVSWQAHVAFTEKAHAEEVRSFLTMIFREASPYERQWPASPVDWLKQVSGRIDHRLGDRPPLRIALLNIVGSSLLNLQDTAAAEAVLTRAVEDATRDLGANHPETLRARVLLTPVYRFRGNTKQLRQELDRVLPLLRAEPAAFAEHLAIALKNRAHLELDEGRYLDAEQAAQEGLDVALQQLGDRHPETVAAFLMVALTHHHNRSPEVALPAAERAYRETIAAYPDMPRHPRVLEARLMYGRALAAAGHLREGVERLTLAVEDAAEVFGPSSRMVGFFSVPLVKYQVQSGRIEQALETSRTALEIIGQHSALDSFRYASALHARGVALVAADRAAEALPLLTRAAETLRRQGPAPHDAMREWMADQSLALAKLGQYEETENVVREIPLAARIP